MISIHVPLVSPRLHLRNGRYHPFPAGTDLALNWSHPTTRTDGTPFLLEHLEYYEIEFGGRNYNMGKATEGLIFTTQPGPWLLRIRTIDTAGQISPWSPLLTVNP